MSYDLEFHGLPRELREYIYQYLLCYPDGIRFDRKRNIERYQKSHCYEIMPYLPVMQFFGSPVVADGQPFSNNPDPQELSRASIHRWGQRTRKMTENWTSLSQRPFCPESWYPKPLSRIAIIDPIDTSIFKTSRTMSHEALDVFYGQNLFDFKDGTSHEIWKFLKNLNGASRQRMRSITLPMRFLKPRDPRGMECGKVYRRIIEPSKGLRVLNFAGWMSSTAVEKEARLVPLLGPMVLYDSLREVRVVYNEYRMIRAWLKSCIDMFGTLGGYRAEEGQVGDGKSLTSDEQHRIEVTTDVEISDPGATLPIRETVLIVRLEPLKLASWEGISAEQAAVWQENREETLAKFDSLRSGCRA